MVQRDGVTSSSPTLQIHKPFSTAFMVGYTHQELGIW